MEWPKYVLMEGAANQPGEFLIRGTAQDRAKRITQGQTVNSQAMIRR